MSTESEAEPAPPSHRERATMIARSAMRKEAFMLLASIIAATITISYSMIEEHRVPPELCFYVPCSLRPEWGCGVCPDRGVAYPAPDPYLGFR